MKTRFLALFALLAFALPAFAADYTVTAANVLTSNVRYLKHGTAAATITAGQSLAKDSTGNLILCDANSATALTRVFVGIAVNGALSGQPVNYVDSDPSFAPGFTIAAGAIVIVSGTAGSLAPAADAATGIYVTVVGVGIGGNKIKMNITAAGVAVP